MGQRARLKETKRKVRKAFEAASEQQKSSLLYALEHGATLKAEEILKILEAK